MNGNTKVECTDYLQRRVIFPPNRLDHVAQRHPEVIPYIDSICDVLSAPDSVWAEYRSNGDSYLYCKLGITLGRLTGTYLVVVVSFNDQDEGLVKTVYASSRLPKGEMIHMRRQL